MSRSVQAADNKMAVMLDRNPLNLRQKQHRWGAAWGIQNRFNQRFCIETVLTQKSSRDYCLEDVAILTEGKSSCRLQVHANLTFSSWRWHIWSPLICARCIPHRIYVALATFTKSRRMNSVCGSLPSSAQFLAFSAYFRLCLEDDRSKFSLCSCKI